MPLLSERAGHDCTGELEKSKVSCTGFYKSEAWWGVGGVTEGLGFRDWVWGLGFRKKFPVGVLRSVLYSVSAVSCAVQEIQHRPTPLSPEDLELPRGYTNYKGLKRRSGIFWVCYGRILLQYQ